MTAPGRRAPARVRRVRALRLRVTAGFALGGLVLVGILSTVTYIFAEHYLVRQRERSLTHQVDGDARVFEADLQRGTSIRTALHSLDRLPNTDVAVYAGGTWYRKSARTTIPEPTRSVVDTVAAGKPTYRLYRGGGPTRFVAGVPLDSVDAQFYETVILEELNSTLRVLRTGLIAGGVLAVVFGGLLGFWMSRRVLRPVTEFARAAQQVSAGDFGTRLAQDGDPDLDSLAISFNEMVDSVEQRIQRETRFVADVSHELRSPLTTLATSVQILSSRGLEIPAQMRPAFELLELEVEHLGELVEDLLELSRADAGVDELDLSAVELGEFMRQAIDPLRADDSRLVIADEIATRRVLVDKRRLERVLANLVVNAETHGDGLERVAVSKHDGVMRIEVDDAGPGVRPEDRTAVFTRFYRGAASGRRASGAGSGLGLSLVAEHVRLHGGQVSIEDVGPSGGARFVVELPWRDP